MKRQTQLLLAVALLCITNTLVAQKMARKAASQQVSVNTSPPPDSILLKKLDDITNKLKELDSKISPAENITPYKDSTKNLTEENKNLQDQIALVEREKKDLAKENSELESKNKYREDLVSKCYEWIAKSLTTSGVYIPGSVLDSISRYVKNANDIKTFKTQSEEIKFVKDLLNNNSIKPDDFEKAKTIVNKTISAGFAGLSNESKLVKADFKMFCTIAKELNIVIMDNKSITDKSYRNGQFTANFSYYEACKLYPYLNEKVTQALTNPNTTIDLVLP